MSLTFEIKNTFTRWKQTDFVITIMLHSFTCIIFDRFFEMSLKKSNVRFFLSSLRLLLQLKSLLYCSGGGGGSACRSNWIGPSEHIGMVGIRLGSFSEICALYIIIQHLFYDIDCLEVTGPNQVWEFRQTSWALTIELLGFVIISDRK